MRKVSLPALLCSGSTAAAIILLLLLASYPVQISASAAYASYTADSFGYEIQELATFPISNLLYNNNSSSEISANRMMAILANSSTSVYETETFIAPPTVKTFVIYMAMSFTRTGLKTLTNILQTKMLIPFRQT